MFKLSVPLVPLASDGGGTTPPPVDHRPFKPAGDSAEPAAAQPVRVPLAQPAPVEPGGERDPAIDALIAQWLSEGWLYVHAPSGEYRNRRSRWRELTEEEKSWNQ